MKAVVLFTPYFEILPRFQFHSFSRQFSPSIPNKESMMDYDIRIHQYLLLLVLPHIQDNMALESPFPAIIKPNPTTPQTSISNHFELISIIFHINRPTIRTDTIFKAVWTEGWIGSFSAEFTHHYPMPTTSFTDH